jgi:predicted aspartyl protease
MGFTYVEVHLYNPADLAKSESIKLLVDTGAIFTSVPRDLLDGLGITPVTRRKLKIYGGAAVEREIGGAVIEHGGKRAVVPVIFGEPDDTAVLGATALESLGYQLDPVTKELKPIELLMV